MPFCTYQRWYAWVTDVLLAYKWMLSLSQVDRHERALTSINSLSTKITKNQQFFQLEHDGNEIFRRGVEAVRLMKEVIEARKILQRLLNDDSVVAKESGN